MTTVYTDTPIPVTRAVADTLPALYPSLQYKVADAGDGSPEHLVALGVGGGKGAAQKVPGVGHFLQYPMDDYPWSGPGLQAQTGHGIDDDVPAAVPGPSTTRHLVQRRYLFKLDDYLAVLRTAPSVPVGHQGVVNEHGGAPNLYLRLDWNQLVPEDSNIWLDGVFPGDPPDPNVQGPLEDIPGEQGWGVAIVVMPDGVDFPGSLDSTFGYRRATTYRGDVGHVQNDYLGNLFAWDTYVVDNYSNNPFSWLAGDTEGDYETEADATVAGTAYFNGAWVLPASDPGSEGERWPKQGDIRTNPHSDLYIPRDDMGHGRFPNLNKGYDPSDGSDPLPAYMQWHPTVAQNDRPGARSLGATAFSAINFQVPVDDPVPPGSAVSPTYYARTHPGGGPTVVWAPVHNVYARGVISLTGAVRGWVSNAHTIAATHTRNVWLVATYRFVGRPSDTTPSADAPHASLHFVDSLVVPPPVAHVATGAAQYGIV